jgi:hypothetical protein
MKPKKVWLCGFMVAFVMVCFAVGTTHAQDLSGWVGKWFKLTGKVKEWNTQDTEGDYFIQTQGNTVSVFLKITSWDTTDPSDPLLRCSGYDQGGGEFNQYIVDLHYLGGTDLDFLCLGIIVDSEHHEQFTARITGKESGEILKSATFKTMGGTSWKKSQFDPRSGKEGGLTLTGSLIPESKLPSWVPK